MWENLDPGLQHLSKAYKYPQFSPTILSLILICAFSMQKLRVSWDAPVENIENTSTTSDL